MDKNWLKNHVKAKGPAPKNEFKVRGSTYEDMKKMVSSIAQNRNMTWVEVKDILINSFRNIDSDQLAGLQLYFTRSKAEFNGTVVETDINFQKPALFMSKYLNDVDPTANFDDIIDAFYKESKSVNADEIDDSTLERLQKLFEKIKSNIEKK